MPSQLRMTSRSRRFGQITRANPPRLEGLDAKTKILSASGRGGEYFS